MTSLRRVLYLGAMWIIIGWTLISAVGCTVNFVEFANTDAAKNDTAMLGAIVGLILNFIIWAVVAVPLAIVGSFLKEPAAQHAGPQTLPSQRQEPTLR